MKANIVDLRYHMSDVIGAINRNEEVIILYRGKEKAVIVPIRKKTLPSVKLHPFFGMHKEDTRQVEDVMANLRADRYRDI